MSDENIKFSTEELARYNRHIILPRFGLEAQEKLKYAKVLVVGCGGLGSPVLLYLAAAGVGTIGIVDHDMVEDHNLQRQVLFNTLEIGKSKVEEAGKKLKALNPHIRINIYRERLRPENATDMIRGYDVLADGSDNFPTRYLVNDACVLLGKPFVYASIYQFEGQVSVFNLKNEMGEPGPNYRDLFPFPPPAGTVPGCAEGGVLGVLAGIIGSMQALEVIKIITGVGETLSGRLFIFDALRFETRHFNISRNPSNPLNGKDPVIRDLARYEDYCGTQQEDRPVRQVTARELHHWQQQGEDFQLVDVREPGEYARFNIGGELIPLSELVAKLGKIERGKKVVVHCQSGERSEKAIRRLEAEFGFTNLYNLSGGIRAYIEEGKGI